MNYLSEPLESQTYREDGPFSAYVFQSQHQRDILTGQLSDVGVPSERLRVIPGPLDLCDFPFRPNHRDSSPFTFGRISRTDPRKYRADWWRVCEEARTRLPVDSRCRVLGWHGSITSKCGPPPMWCEVLGKDGEEVGVFLRSLHCLVQLGDATENWPRVGLEAMASGVPVVADRRGGWREMIRDGETGFLVSDAEEAIDATCRLSSNEAIRLEIAERARIAVEDMTDESLLWVLWNNLFTKLT
jgi:glycosyltransferase involved in cell wall biosynthesis